MIIQFNNVQTVLNAYLETVPHDILGSMRIVRRKYARKLFFQLLFWKGRHKNIKNKFLSETKGKKLYTFPKYITDGINLQHQ